MKSFRQYLIFEQIEDFFNEKAISPKEARKEAREIDDLNSKQAKELYKNLIDTINSSKYSKTIDFIDDISKDKKLKFILSLGFGGRLADLNLKINEMSLNVRDLIPTQNEIGVDETFKYILQGKNIEYCFQNPAVIRKPIVVFNSKYIIDGHHRWSEIYITNPNAKVDVVNISGNLSPINALKVFQCTIASNLGKVIRTSKKGKNLLDLSKNEISKYCDEISQEARNKFNAYGIYDVEHYLLSNCLEMQKNNEHIDNAPPRTEMPQTSKDPDLFNDLENGVTKIH